GDTTAARRAARRANRRAVTTAPAAAWLPRVTVRDAASGRTVRRGVPCGAVSRPTQNAGLGTITVLTVGVGAGLSLTDTDTILTDGEVVYASPSALYVATPRWAPQVDGAAAPPRGATQIHKLDTSDPARTDYRASGVVAGYPLNQFSLSEHEGHLRVATTEEPEWWEPQDAAEPSESRVTVLAQSGGRLVRTGEVRGLGRGERIYSVRFLGDRGYVVTFRQTDPLYALDLSDPAAPVLRGELKIPGFSSYLHPVDDTTLIGVGQAADAQGRTQGTQVSLFDVSDPSRPARIAQRSLDTDWSEAESDHHAFLWWPQSKLLVLPVQAYGGPGRSAFLGAVGLNVDRATGITPIARVAHPGDPDVDWAPVRRSLVVGTTLYTVSDAGIMGSDLGTLAPRGWAAFG
ncbi:MAG: beta-propeller domain-containing protein, partial [Thermoleophilia bacterium]